MRNPFLIGPRLYLRPLEREDAPRLTGYINDPAVRRTLLMHRPMSVGQEQVLMGILRSEWKPLTLPSARADRESAKG